MNAPVHFCLVSDQPLGNLLPALDPERPASRVVLATTPQMRRQAEAHRRVLLGYKVQTELLALPDPYDMANAGSVIQEWLSARNPDEGAVWLNATGGTKLLAMAAQEVFRAAGAPVFYLTLGGQVVFLAGQHPSYTVGTRLKLRAMVAAHDWTALHKDPLDADVFLNEHGELIDWLGENAPRLAEGLRQLKRALSSVGNGGTIPRKMVIKELRTRLIEAGMLLESHGGELRCADSSINNFLSGKWLERYVLRCATRLNRVHDLAMSMFLVDGKVLEGESLTGRTTNEIDVAMLYANKLFAIECKTVSDRDQYMDFIYKIAFQQRMGGHGTRVGLVTTCPLNDAIRDRAKLARLALLELDDLPNCERWLGRWLDSAAD